MQKRSWLLGVSAAVLLAACATDQAQQKSDAKPAAATQQQQAEKKDAPPPRCFNPNDGKFYNVGESATIAGVKSKCELTGDKKGALWKTQR